MASHHHLRFAGPRGPFLVGSVLLALTGCAKGSTGPSDGGPATPGWLTVELNTPNTDDGAVQLRVSGAQVDTVRVANAYQGFGVASSAGADLVITGGVAKGVVAHLKVPDVNRSGRYTVSVVAAARRGSYELRALGEYRAAVVR
jgi:hypothetical protein